MQNSEGNKQQVDNLADLEQTERQDPEPKTEPEVDQELSPFTKCVLRAFNRRATTTVQIFPEERKEQNDN